MAFGSPSPKNPTRPFLVPKSRLIGKYPLVAHRQPTLIEIHSHQGCTCGTRISIIIHGNSENFNPYAYLFITSAYLRTELSSTYSLPGPSVNLNRRSSGCTSIRCLRDFREWSFFISDQNIIAGSRSLRDYKSPIILVRQ